MKKKKKKFYKVNHKDKDEDSLLPKTALESFIQCDDDLYPKIKILLQYLTTLPVSNATSERTFSTLRRCKNWLRCCMANERLNGLCLVHCHRDILIKIDKVIDRFAKEKHRRLDFVI